MDGGTWLMIVFLALLWALPISQDIEEAAAMEERVVDHQDSRRNCVTGTPHLGQAYYLEFISHHLLF